ncbi:hypothetical protein HK098_007732 [Nowakowskiella sp. JEL0407]|nr:hypothetical protein HK098_007732 [Nowakowskiella sp. JEL0407]
MTILIELIIDTGNIERFELGIEDSDFKDFAGKFLITFKASSTLKQLEYFDFSEFSGWRTNKVVADLITHNSTLTKLSVCMDSQSSKLLDAIVNSKSLKVLSLHRYAYVHHLEPILTRNMSLEEPHFQMNDLECSVTEVAKCFKRNPDMNIKRMRFVSIATNKHGGYIRIDMVNSVVRIKISRCDWYSSEVFKMWLKQEFAIGILVVSTEKRKVIDDIQESEQLDSAYFEIKQGLWIYSTPPRIGNSYADEFFRFSYTCKQIYVLVFPLSYSSIILTTDSYKNFTFHCEKLANSTFLSLVGKYTKTLKLSVTANRVVKFNLGVLPKFENLRSLQCAIMHYLSPDRLAEIYALGPSLRNLRELKLSQMRMSIESLRAIAKIFSKLELIESIVLDFSSVPVFSYSSSPIKLDPSPEIVREVNGLAGIISSLKNLQTLEMVRFEYEADVELFTRVIKSLRSIRGFETLRVGWCGMRDLMLCTSFEHLKSLQVNLTPDAAVSAASSIRQCCSLTHLKLEAAEISVSALFALFDARQPGRVPINTEISALKCLSNDFDVSLTIDTENVQRFELRTEDRDFNDFVCRLLVSFKESSMLKQLALFGVSISHDEDRDNVVADLISHNSTLTNLNVSMSLAESTLVDAIVNSKFLKVLTLQGYLYSRHLEQILMNNVKLEEVHLQKSDLNCKVTFVAKYLNIERTRVVSISNDNGGYIRFDIVNSVVRMKITRYDPYSYLVDDILQMWLLNGDFTIGIVVVSAEKVKVIKKIQESEQLDVLLDKDLAYSEIKDGDLCIYSTPPV